jgi:hypothetical protein
MRVRMSRLVVERESLCMLSLRKAAMRLCMITKGTYNSFLSLMKGMRARVRPRRMRDLQSERKTRKNSSRVCASAMLLDIAKGRTSPGTLHLTDPPVRAIINLQASWCLLSSQVRTFGVTRTRAE